jgi:hypothetical protein
VDLGVHCQRPIRVASLPTVERVLVGKGSIHRGCPSDVIETPPPIRSVPRPLILSTPILRGASNVEFA